MNQVDDPEMLPRSWQRWLAVCGALLAINVAIGAWYHRRGMAASGEDQSYAAMTEYAAAVRAIRNEYVDPGKTAYENLTRGSIGGALAELDPFSHYFPAQRYKAIEESSKGEFGGIGVVIATDREQHLIVVRPIPDSPAMAAGLQAGDWIVGVNGEPLERATVEEASERIKGPTGTTVALTIFRPATRETLEITVERAVIQVPSVVDMTMVQPGIAYVRVIQFGEKTVDELQAALAKLHAEHEVAGLILDLRLNPGGLLPAAIGVSSLFLPQGALVVTTEGRSPEYYARFEVRTTPAYPRLPLVILINGASASAAEIVAGCLHDHGRATLVGETTFGKGTVQKPIPLPGGATMHLTTAHYYTPSRQVIHEHGIAPDVVVPLTERIAERFYQPNGAQPEPLEDPQLARGIAVLLQQLGEPVPAAVEAAVADDQATADTPAAVDLPAPDIP